MRELLLRAPHFGVVAAHGLNFQQLALRVEHAAIRPDPPRMFPTGQLQVDLGGTHRKLGAQLTQALGECLALFLGHPVAQIHPRQLFRRAFQIRRQRLVAEGQGQVRAIAADHRWRVFHQNPVTLLALLDPLGRQGRFGDVQPQANGFHRQAKVIAQQLGFIEQPVVIATTVAQPIAAAHRTFAQQLASAFEIAVAVLGVNPFHQRAGGAFGEGPAEQRPQAVAEEGRLQCAFDVALHVNDRGRTGDQIVQPRMGRGGVLFLVLDVADVEHETDQTPVLADAQGLALQAIPGGRRGVIERTQAHAQQQRRAFILQGLQATAQLFAVGWVHLIKPVLQWQTQAPEVQRAGQ
ncbi:hypothetical protein D3C85_1034510 [compost metagenome]